MRKTWSHHLYSMYLYGYIHRDTYSMYLYGYITERHIVTLCGYITSSAVLWCEGRKEPRHGSLRIILFRPSLG